MDAVPNQGRRNSFPPSTFLRPAPVNMCTSKYVRTSCGRNEVRRSKVWP